jgi:hypothetical protein
MPFMLLILIFLLCAVVWGFFHSNPRGVAAGRVLACNIVVVALALLAAARVGLVLHADALATKPGEAALAAYLAVMAAGTLFMIVLAVGGLTRNLLLFPLSRRKAA